MANCNQCKNQCPEDALKCGRGREYFGLEDQKEEETKFYKGKRNLEEQEDVEIVSLLRRCGHMLHHRKLSSDELMMKFSKEEQTQLVTLLQKIFS